LGRMICTIHFVLFAVMGCLLTGCGVPAETPEPPDAALFYVTNDVHFLAGSLHDRGARYQQVITERDGKNVEMTESLLRALLYQAEQEKPDIILFNGDLTYNGEAASHRALAKYFAALEELGVKAYVIPGNHDIENPWARSFFNDQAFYADSVSPGEFRNIYRDFGYAEARSRDRATLSYVAEPLPGLRLLMLDSNNYAHNRAQGYPETGGAIRPGTRKWIRKAAESARKDGALLVAAMHHSLMDHHPMVNEGFTVEDSGSLRELFTSLGINFILTGHIHAQDISMRQTASGPVYDIATSALSVYPHQIGSLRLRPDEGLWRYSVKALDVEGWARDTGAADERLLGFNAYAESFFKRSAGDMVRRRLDAGEGAVILSAEELTALSELMGTLNARYFAGLSSLNSQDIPQSEGFRLLETHQFEFLYGYARTIMEDTPPANTEVSIPIPNYP